jgi:hypothetical protein
MPMVSPPPALRGIAQIAATLRPAIDAAESERARLLSEAEKDESKK